MSSLPEVSDATFKAQVIDSANPVVVDFWAPWCMPCRMLGPIMEKLAEKNAGRVTFYKLNTDQNPEASRQYRIMSIPSVVMFKGGQEVNRLIGVQPEDALQREIDKL
jgi:thioredoxin 1